MLYVLLGHRIAQDGVLPGLTAWGAAMLIALMTITPLGLGGALPAMMHPLLVLVWGFSWLQAGLPSIGKMRHSPASKRETKLRLRKREAEQ